MFGNLVGAAQRFLEPVKKKVQGVVSNVGRSVQQFFSPPKPQPTRTTSTTGMRSGFAPGGGFSGGGGGGGGGGSTPRPSQPAPRPSVPSGGGGSWGGQDGGLMGAAQRAIQEYAPQFNTTLQNLGSALQKNVVAPIASKTKSAVSTLYKPVQAARDINTRANEAIKTGVQTGL